MHVAALEQLDHPARVEIETKTDAAANLRQMLHSEAQAPGAAGPDHDPIGAAREKLVGKSVRKLLVIDAEVLVVDPRFRHTRAAARFKCADRLAGVGLRHPASHRPASQPLILEKPKTIEIVIRLYLAARIEIERLGALEPERGAGLRIKVPLDDFTSPGVEDGAR